MTLILFRICQREGQRTIIRRHFSEDRHPRQRHAVAHLVEALPYNPEGREVDSRWCHWNFLLT
jgi:hypothetical protein